MSAAWPLACPVCEASLVEDDGGRVLRCAARHSFDVARQGHVNLLAAGRGRPATTGDTRAMVEARRRFLASGHYAPLLDAVADEVAQGVAAALGDVRGPPAKEEPGSAVVVDIGCGEGTYLARAREAVARTSAARAEGGGTSSAAEVCFFGVDLAKDAVRMAASAQKNARFVVADVRHRLPFVDESVDVALNVFAPREVGELARVCRAGARLVVVIPEADHLLELRERFGLLGIEEEKRERTLARLAPSFALEEEHAVRAPLHLEGPALRDLLAMTPSAFHGAGRDADPAANSGAVTAALSARILRLRRNGPRSAW